MNEEGLSITILNALTTIAGHHATESDLITTRHFVMSELSLSNPLTLTVVGRLEQEKGLVKGISAIEDR